MTETCVACGEKHDYHKWRLTSEDWICGRHFSTSRSLDSRIADMSPEEVLSGAQYGVKTAWGKPKSKQNFSKEQRHQTQVLREVLK